MPITRLPAADIPVISVWLAEPVRGRGRRSSSVQAPSHRRQRLGLEGVRHIASQISEGMSVTTIEFRRRPKTIADSTKRKDAVTGPRPTSAHGEHRRGEPLEVQRVMYVALTQMSPMPRSRRAQQKERLSAFVDDVVQTSLQGLRGVAQVERVGASSARYGTLDPHGAGE